MENLIRIGKPDAVKLGILVQKARGLRTSKAFAEELGVDAGTISRLQSGNRPNGLSEKLLRKIAEHAADGSGISLSDLAAANGMMLECDHASNKLQKMIPGIIMGLEGNQGCCIEVSPNFTLNGFNYSPFDYLVSPTQRTVANHEITGYILSLNAEFSRQNKTGGAAKVCMDKIIEISGLASMHENSAFPKISHLVFIFNDNSEFWEAEALTQILEYNRTPLSFGVKVCCVDESGTAEIM